MNSLIVIVLLVWGCVGVMLAAALAGTIKQRELQIPREDRPHEESTD